jgi:UDP-N-acetylmuramyl pentapeptide synthase
MSLTVNTSPIVTTQAQYILTDSRQVSFPGQSIFFAIKGERHDGHRFLPELYQAGVREFVVEEAAFTGELRETAAAWADAQIWVVASSIRALQQLVASKRKQFEIPLWALQEVMAKPS